MKSKQVYRIASLAFSLIAVVFFAVYTAKYFKDIPKINWETASFSASALSIALITFSIGIAGVIWQLLLRDSNCISLDWKKIQVIYSISQFGKYLPGNIGQHVGRVFMARAFGIPTFTSINTMLIEILWGIGVGTGLSLLSLLFFVDATFINNWTNISTIELILFFIVAVLLPIFGIRFINFFLPGLARKLSGGDYIKEPRPITALKVSCLFLLNFLIMGIIIKLQAHWIFGQMNGDVLELTCLFAVAWIIGYLMPGAPAGLGIREVLMIILLTPVFGNGTAVGLSITLRLTTTFGDALAFILGLLGRKFLHIQNI